MDFVRVMSFEPDAEEHARLLAKQRVGDLCLPTALFSTKGEIEINLTKARGSSSIYKPNMKFLSQYTDAARFTVEKKISVECDTLDHLTAAEKIPKIDFIKLDVQGAELDILKGGKTALASEAIAIELEV